MIRGVNKKVIEVSNPKNQYFEKVILFVNPKALVDDNYIYTQSEEYIEFLQNKIQGKYKSNYKFKIKLLSFISVILALAIVVILFLFLR